jgi:hypothetical protein
MSRIPHLHYYLEKRDDIAYHTCSLPGSDHVHYIPLRFSTCYDDGCWTWESVYS